MLSGILSGIFSDIHSIWHLFWRSICHSIWHSVWHSLWHVFRSRASPQPVQGHSTASLACDVTGGVATPQPPDLAVEIRQCPLRSVARSWGSAVPTEMWSSQLKSGRRKEKEKKEKEKEKEQVTLINLETLTWQVGKNSYFHDTHQEDKHDFETKNMSTPAHWSCLREAIRECSQQPTLVPNSAKNKTQVGSSAPI